jgi:hypothetical protein
MKERPGKPWRPSNELLAAFADGELEDRPELTVWRERVERWLAANRQAARDVETQRDLARLIAATTPEVPPPHVWDRIWAQIQAPPLRGKGKWKAAAWLAGLVAIGSAAAAVFFFAGVWRSDPMPVSSSGIEANSAGDSAARLVHSMPSKKPSAEPKSTQFTDLKGAVQEKMQVLKVATADEIEILRVPGCDTCTLIVGRPPLTGPIVLLAPNEVEVSLPAEDPAGPNLRISGGGNPMLWAPPASAKDDDLE